MSMTLSDDELMDILASVAGDTPVVEPKKEDPPAPAVEEEALAALDALEEPAAVEAVAPTPPEESIEDLVAGLDKEEITTIASGGVLTDPETEIAAIAALVAEPVADDKEAYIPLGDKTVTITIKEPEPEVSTEVMDVVEEPEPTPAPSGEKKVVGIQYFIDPARLARDVAISMTNLDDALMTHASNFVHYAVQAANARRQFERMKAAFEILESKLDNKWRVILKEENPKTTEAQIRAAVVGDKEWSQANVRMIEARTIYELAGDAKEAFTMRRDMLTQLAKDAREERLGQMRVQAGTDARERVGDMLREAAGS